MRKLKDDTKKSIKEKLVSALIDLIVGIILIAISKIIE